MKNDDFSGGRDPAAILEKLRAAFSEAAAAPPFANARENARALLDGFMREMDVVTREEFDAQSRLLAAAVKKLEAIEARIEARAKEETAKAERKKTAGKKPAKNATDS